MYYLAGIIITFFLAILLVGKRGKSGADRILAAWLIVVGFHLTAFYLYLSGAWLKFPWWLGLELPLPLVHGPFLYLYTTALTKKGRFRGIDLLHFQPVIIVYALMTSFFLLPVKEKVFVYQNDGVGYEWLTDNLFIAFISSGILYVILSFLRLRQHKINIENQFSNTAKINLNWLRYLVYGTSVIWLVVITGLGDMYIFGTVVIFVFFIGYFGIRQVGIFSNMLLSGEKSDTASEKNLIQRSSPIDLPKNISEPVPPVAKLKYQKSSLTGNDAKSIHDQLHQLMVKDKLFKNPDLNLGELAETLKVHPNTLSQVINSFENKTFYDYINGLRIDEFKSLLTDPASRQFTLLSLAFECGFNSKTAFNRNFKKATGQSPSDFLKKMNVDFVEID